MKKTYFLVFMSILIVGAIGLFQNTTNVEVSPAIITVGPNDLNAVKTAHSLVSNSLKISDKPIIVEFKAGTYYAQSITWTAVPKAYSIIFRPERGAEDKVIFDGRKNAEEAARGSKGSVIKLFSFKPADVNLGKETSIIIQSIKVQYYVEAIDFLANRDNPNLFLKKSMVTNSTFTNIGDLYAEVYSSSGALIDGKAVIRLVNSSNGFFIYNRFENIRNHRGNGQHAFYIAHLSKNNLIEGNVFINHMNGSVIKLRDKSDNNKIVSNVFNGFSPSAIQVWHCDANEVMNSGNLRGFNNASLGFNGPSGCTKFKYDKSSGAISNTECYSYGAEERGNSFIKNGRVVSSGEVIDRYENYNAFCGSKDSSKTFIVADRKINQGVLIASINGSEYKFGICSSANDCVNGSNSCFKNGTGSAHLLCENRVWLKCNERNLKQMSNGNICIYNENVTDTVWTKIPANTFYVESLMGGKMNRGFCPTSNSCLNTKKQCYSDLGFSAHMLCVKQDWKVCNIKENGKQFGNVRCSYSSAAKDYVWKKI